MKGFSYKNCIICGVLEHIHVHVDTCERCRTKQCEVCAEEFTVRGRKDGKKKFCSHACSARSQYKVFVDVTCVNCGFVFEGYPSKKYCDGCLKERKSECDARYRMKNEKQIKAQKKKTYYAGKKRKCPVCEKDFTRAGFVHAKFCSRDCFHKDSKKSRKKKKNPNYRNGSHINAHYCKDYADWVYKERGLLLEELGCEICGVMSGVIFDRHHIVFKSEMGYHDEINNPRNIIQVCRTCHSDYHGKRRSRDTLVADRGLEELFDAKLIFN